MFQQNLSFLSFIGMFVLSHLPVSIYNLCAESLNLVKAIKFRIALARLRLSCVHENMHKLDFVNSIDPDQPVYSDQDIHCSHTPYTGVLVMSTCESFDKTEKCTR